MSAASFAAASPGAAAGGDAALLTPSATASSFTDLAGLPLFLALALEFFGFFGFSSVAARLAGDLAVEVLAAAVLAVAVLAVAVLAVEVLAAVVRAEAVLADEDAVPVRFAAGLARVAELRAVADVDEELSVAAGIADDMALAASVSDFTAVSIALVAVLIERSAPVIVLAESVARVAAVFSFAAALFTFVAADETARGDDAVAALAARRVVVLDALVPVARVPVPRVLAVLRLAAVRVPVPRVVAVVRLAAVRVPVARVPVARLAVVRVEVVLAALARPVLAPWLTGLEAAVSVGTDLPLSRSVTGGLIPRTVMFYTW